MYYPMITDFLKTALAYWLLMFGFGMLTFRFMVAKEKWQYRLMAYLVVSHVLIIAVGNLLALFRIYTLFSIIFTLILTLWGVKLYIDHRTTITYTMAWFADINHLFEGRYGLKLYMYHQVQKLKSLIGQSWKATFAIRPSATSVFLLLLVYNAYFFGINRIRFVSYGALDEEVHLYWIQSMLGGNIYPSGVYPHGFHHIIATLSEVMMVNPVVIMGIFGVIIRLLALFVLYMAMTLVFKSRTAILSGMAVYTFINIFDVEAIYRFQFAIPQEYGMFSLVTMVVFLITYLHHKRTRDLVLFGMSFALTAFFHFYLTLIALVICLVIGLVYLVPILKHRLLLPLIFCGLVASSLALAPIVIGVALGNPLEQSMDWAMGIFLDDDRQVSPSVNESVESEEEDLEPLTLTWIYNKAVRDIEKHVMVNFSSFILYIGLLSLACLVGLVGLLKKDTRQGAQVVLALSLILVSLCFLSLVRAFRLPTIMEIKRVAIFLGFFSPIVYAFPLEVLNRFLAYMGFKKQFYYGVAAMLPSLALITTTYPVTQSQLPFYYFQTKGAMVVNRQLIQRPPDGTWTIVAPVNNISAILNTGFHYELSEFVLNQEGWQPTTKIEIPTEYVYIYIEKAPIVEYGYRFNALDGAIINRPMVTAKKAKVPLSSVLSDEVSYRDYRSSLMSKLYFWAKTYKTYFPEEMTLYYEDHEMLIYQIHQDPLSLNNFAIDYGFNRPGGGE